MKKSNRATKQSQASADSAACEAEVTIDRRRGSRREEQAEVSEVTESTAGPKLERRKKVNRRRQIDPTTCERDYTDQEVEFMNALDDYKRKSGRMFPTCSEVLEVIQALGYVKLAPGQAGLATSGACVASAKPMPENLQQAPVSDELFLPVGDLS